MTDETLLAPFDDDVLGQVAAANDIELDALERAVADHQRAMRENPGVEDLVYEWRKQYDDPVLVRTPDLFILALPPTVWEQYADYLDFDDGTLAAVTAVHGEQTIRTEAVEFSDIPRDHVALVVHRP
ncbi:hypothetical protein [Haloarcula onubensis]|uniref:DUF8048 domain-containing protein n=1 Tax=Haloarcula onubensis TaxID=2950539 RepID=A0ABU2FRD0_9EURY|nr:hypothetical protein [Halomicroarcula sp. S3CR25-11]MDS0283318.1 hypothetical protein [Halomicroarcula sp. S3CR25-11]